LDIAGDTSSLGRRTCSRTIVRSARSACRSLSRPRSPAPGFAGGRCCVARAPYVLAYNSTLRVFGWSLLVSPAISGARLVIGRDGEERRRFARPACYRPGRGGAAALRAPGLLVAGDGGRRRRYARRACYRLGRGGAATLRAPGLLVAGAYASGIRDGAGRRIMIA